MESPRSDPAADSAARNVSLGRSALAAVVILLIAAGTIVRLNMNQQGYDDRQQDLVRLERSLLDMRDAGWLAALTGEDADIVGGRTAPNDALVQMRAALQAFDAAKVGNLPPDLEALRGRTSEAVRGIDALLVAGQPGEARAAMSSAAGDFIVLRAGIGEEREIARTNSERFQRISTWGAVGTMLIAAAFVGLLSWNAERTRRKAADATVHQYRELALMDTLTNLPNRAQFLDRLNQSLARARSLKGSLAVLFIDIDNFKSVNDTMGHAAGDTLIALVARRIESAVRPSDACARLGGDEFAIIIDAIGDLEHSTLVTERILAAMDDPFEIEGKQMAVHCSIGLAISEQGDEPADELMRNADVAMYVAKSRGKARFEIYEPSMHPELVEQRELLDDLAQALDRAELVNYYQPVIDMQTGHIVGAEALIRWNHPSRRLVPPIKFIPLAEQSGLIVPIGRWVLYEACRQAAVWRIRFPETRQFTMHVNLSVRQLQEDGFIGDLKTVLRDCNTDPSTLTLELTESMMIADDSSWSHRVQQIRHLGVRIAIDDFGTGYSSLSYLQQLPVDAIKIDRSFTERLSADGRNFEVTRSIVELGLSLGLDIVAEGIEHIGQEAAFRSLGCTHGQGYYYARPMPAGDFAKLISREIFTPATPARRAA